MAGPFHQTDFNKGLFVAVHAGAGSHSEEKTSEYKDLCRRACLQAMCLLKKRKSAPEAVAAAVSVLEDSELSNAGRGSNLTIDGRVECDASVMEGCRSLFGAVGCVSGVLNPVQVACRLLLTQQHCSLSLGRVPPSVLVGTGAEVWAKQQGFSCEDHLRLITENSTRLYRKYKRKVDRAESLHTTNKTRCTNDTSAPAPAESHHAPANGPPASPHLLKSDTGPPSVASTHSTSARISQPGPLRSGTEVNTDGADSDSAQRSADERKDGTDVRTREEVEGSAKEGPAQDTVGAVCVDWEGNISAAVSSGGIWLKHPGRLGPAAMYGAGCWAQNADKGLPGVAVITSGCGEHLMRTSLAKTCAECLMSAEDPTEGLRACFNQQFLESRLLSGVSSRLAGAVAVRISHTEQGAPDVEVCWGHTTDSMALGYLRGDSQKPRALLSRLGEDCQAGHSFTMSSAFFSPG